METSNAENTDLKEKKVFIARTILFCIFGCVLPFVFIAWRYDIFGGTRIALTGWGFIAVIIVFFFVVYCLKILKNSIPFSMTYQILSGFIKVILPLLLVLLIVNGIEDNIRQFKQALIVTILSEGIAIVVNPFPKFMHDKGIEKTENLMDTFITKLKAKEKE